MLLNLKLEKQLSKYYNYKKNAFPLKHSSMINISTNLKSTIIYSNTLKSDLKKQ